MGLFGNTEWTIPVPKHIISDYKNSCEKGFYFNNKKINNIEEGMKLIIEVVEELSKNMQQSSMTVLIGIEFSLKIFIESIINSNNSIAFPSSIEIEKQFLEYLFEQRNRVNKSNTMFSNFFKRLPIEIKDDSILKYIFMHETMFINMSNKNTNKLINFGYILEEYYHNIEGEKPLKEIIDRNPSFILSFITFLFNNLIKEYEDIKSSMLLPQIVFSFNFKETGEFD